MRKQLPHLWDVPASGFSVLIFLTVCFGAGALAGCFFAGLLGLDAQTQLSAYLNGYFTVLRGGEVILPSLFSTVWELCRWPALVFLLGLTALGAVGIPVVFGVRGFLFSYSVSVFVRLFGGSGLLAALAIFGVSGFFTLPALFLLGTGGFGSARVLAGALLGEGRHGSPFHRGYFVRAGGCCVLLAAGVLLQSWLTPVLLRAAAGLIS